MTGTHWLSTDGSASTLLVLALLSLLPLLLIASTAFVKISTALQIARSALGTRDVPSGSVLLVLAIALTMLTMAPVTRTVLARSAPLLAGHLEPNALLAEGVRAVGDPLMDFMKKNALPRHLAHFAALATSSGHSGEPDLLVLLPAFVVSELERAFSIGLAIYLPFAVLDLVVANVLAAAGLASLSPTSLALPLKLLLFLSMDGFRLLTKALVLGYQY